MTTYKPKKSTVFLYDFKVNGRRYSGSTKVRTKREADRVEDKIRAAIALNISVGTKRPITLDEAAGQYEDYLRANGKWSATMDYLIANVVDGLGGENLLSNIRQEDLAAHFAKRAGKVSASSVNREIEVARPIWRRQAKHRDIGEMPDWGQLRFKVAEKDPRELHFDEEERLFANLREDLRDFARFALLTGWRLKEVRMLRWADVNLGIRTARTVVKGGNSVVRPLTDEMVTIIANQAKAGPFVFTYVCQKRRKGFVDRKGRYHPPRVAGDRYPLSQTGWRKPWRDAMGTAAVDDFCFHDLRHTRGTRILRATGNLRAAQRALDHKNIRTTTRYAHAFDDDVRSALEASESRTIPTISQGSDEKRRNSGEN